jgi:phosphonate transport system permease protein
MSGAALTTLADRESGSERTRGVRRSAAGRRGPLVPARVWWMLLAAGLAWSLWDAGVGRVAVLNPGGWELQRRFWTAAARPELSSSFLTTIGRDALTTLAFAVLGTALSVLIGLAGAVTISETWWRARRTGTAGRDRRAGWLVARGVWSVPRGIHEAVWGLYLVNVLGRDPLVGVLAIAIPFGAITAKVYAELLDEAAGDAYHALRAIGAGRVTALAYGALPIALPDLVSYAFYRLECSIRSAVILGMIGAGGIGFRLSLSFQALAYREMWTAIYALVAISAIADRWGSWLRRRAGSRDVRRSLAVGAVLVFASAARLRPDLGRLFSERTRSLLVDLVERSWLPSAPRDGWTGLLARAVDTFQMSLLAITIAAAVSLSLAFIAARGGRTPVGRGLSFVARLVLLFTRAVPPPVWALLVLFVMYPGPLPGAVALGIYNAGILGRLCAEVVENLDERPARALQALGAPAVAAFAYATVPQAAPRFAAYSLYRWEVALRETVIVGVVGAGGLGRLLEQQRAAFDYSGMLATVLALLALSVVVDAISTAVRRSLR